MPSPTPSAFHPFTPSSFSSSSPSFCFSLLELFSPVPSFTPFFPYSSPLSSPSLHSLLPHPSLPPLFVLLSVFLFLLFLILLLLFHILSTSFWFHWTCSPSHLFHGHYFK